MSRESPRGTAPDAKRHDNWPVHGDTETGWDTLSEFAQEHLESDE